MLGAQIDASTVVVHPSERGHLKQALLKIGWPAEDLAGYVDGEQHPSPCANRAGACGSTRGGRGERVSRRFRVVVLPCGAGKTIVGAASMALAQSTTLILVTNTVAARQWRDELIARTSCRREIGEYRGSPKRSGR